MAKAQVCLVCEKYQLDREYASMFDALDRRFDLTRYVIDGPWPESIDDIAGHDGCAAVIWYVRFRKLVKRPPFDWRDYSGQRVMYDFDAYQNFSTMAGDRYLGAWPAVFRAHRFDTLVCTGKATRDDLIGHGVNAVWVPKAYDPARFFDKGEARQGIGYFGQLYDARVAMLERLEEAELPVTRFKCAYADLNDHLNRFAMCVICNMVGVRRKMRRRLSDYLFPHYETEVFPGPEVMQKNFEVAASGCAPVCDDIPELHDLGFRDGESMISYRSLDELVEKLHGYVADSNAVASIAGNAAALCRERHTWDHRADMFAALVTGGSVEL
jgi:hypothetical protein